MADKQIMIDGLFCDNCPEAQRCQEQQAKKEYAINQVLQDVPSEYANVIDRLKQIIPSITRCDYVLEKQLKQLKQTLTEIKEIAEKVYNDCDNCYRDVDTNYDVDCIDCTLGGKAKLAEQILQKISEVIPSEN